MADYTGLPFFVGAPAGEGSSCDGGEGCKPGPGGSVPTSSGSYHSGNCYCLDAQVSVLLWNGDEKEAGKVLVGDELFGISDSGCPRMQTVTSTESSSQPRLKIIFESGELVCTATHPLRGATGVWIRAGDVREGTVLACFENREVVVVSVHQLNEAEVFTWSCEPDHVFVAAKLIHHNFKNVPQWGVWS